MAILLAVFTISNPLFAQIQIGTDLDGEAEGDNLGHSVSLSSDGNRLAIGAIYNDGSGSNTGHVRVYDWNGESWTQLGQDIDGENNNDWSGHSVSLSSDGNRLAIGTPGGDANGSDAGHVRIYDWDGNNWAQVGAPINGAFSYAIFGFSLSLSSDGSRVAVGAISETCQDMPPYMNGMVRVGYSLGKISAGKWPVSNLVQQFRSPQMVVG